MSAIKVCPDCKHTHAGRELAGICVGCPCETDMRPFLSAAHDEVDSAFREAEEWIEGFEVIAEAEHVGHHDGAMRFCANQVCRYIEERR